MIKTETFIGRTNDKLFQLQSTCIITYETKGFSSRTEFLDRVRETFAKEFSTPGKIYQKKNIILKKIS